jgi:proteasome lid subunit RPN8/RPN11
MRACTLNKTVLAAVIAHAKAEFPRECCGVVIVVNGKRRYVPCKNIAEDDNNFHISPGDWADAEDKGEIAYVVHSHVNASPLPSEADKVSCEASGLPWVIVNCPGDTVCEFVPTGFKQPLIGREFCHAVSDCYSLVRDYYKQALNIDLPDFERRVEWWDKGDNLYLDNFKKAGFVEIDADDVQKNDIFLMQLMSPVPNHAAIYLGDGTMVQHCMGRLSSRDVYGGFWKKSTVKVVRYKGIDSADN